VAGAERRSAAPPSDAQKQAALRALRAKSNVSTSIVVISLTLGASSTRNLPSPRVVVSIQTSASGLLREIRSRRVSTPTAVWSRWILAVGVET
jgi:hypothetical protein